MTPTLLFLHIPKTAGTTLTKLIYEEYAGRQETSQAYLDKGRMKLAAGVLYVRENLSAGFYRDDYVPSLSESEERVLRRRDVEVIIGHFTFGIHRYLTHSSSYITLLRDPVDRVTSLYQHLFAYPDHYDVNALVTGSQMGLTEFVTELGRRETDNDQVRRCSGIDAPFGECSREMLEQAKANLAQSFLVVGLMERFDESLALLEERLGWSRELYRPRLVNRNHHGKPSLTKRELAAVRSQNELDLELYGFAQNLLAEALAAAGPGVRRRAKRLARKNRHALQRARGAEQPDRTVNLNTGDPDRLQQLPGIGRVLADRIVEYRDDVGEFESVQQLQEVSGIGPRMISNILSRIEV